jgi:hypothetical protein
MRRNREADLLSSFQVDHQLKLGGLLKRKVASLGSVEDPVYITPGAAS